MLPEEFDLLFLGMYSFIIINTEEYLHIYYIESLELIICIAFSHKTNWEKLSKMKNKIKEKKEQKSQDCEK